MGNPASYLITLSLIFICKISLSQPCIQANAGGNKTICPPGGSVVLGTPSVSGATYSWSPSTGLSNPSIAQPIASPTTTTTYTLTVTTGQNLLQNGDFENGYTGFNTDYAIFPNSDGSCGQFTSFGSIGVTTNPSSLSSHWCNMTDHSPIGNNMLTVDGSHFPNRRVWFTTIPVTPNTTYSFSGWSTSNANWINPMFASNLRFQINGVIVSQNYLVPALQCQGWGQFSMNWFSGTSTTALIEIFDDNLDCAQNDFNIDDLSFTNCPASTDQATVCVCQPPPSPEIVTVKIPIYSSYNMWKGGTNPGHFCFDPRLTYHRHYQYDNRCGGDMMSGFKMADNNMNSYQCFDVTFFMYPRPYNNSLTTTYLEFVQNDLSIYENCFAGDIISANLKLFHKTANYPICDGKLWPLSEFNLVQPHSGLNAFTVKRSTDPRLYKGHSCWDGAPYNYDNPPPTGPEVINITSSITGYQDYTVDVTQMVKNSLTTNTRHIGFLIQQVENSTYNNVLFQGNINEQTDIDRPYIELTYIRRKRPNPCNLTRTSIGEAESRVTNFHNEQQESEFVKSSIVPNPSRTEATLSCPHKILKIEIFTVSGALLRTLNPLGQKICSLNLSDLISGVYICRLTSEKGTEQLKFIIQR